MTEEEIKKTLGRGKDLRGQKFGMLTPLYPVEKRNGQVYWKCQCDCGKTVIARGSSITDKVKRGVNANCGCFKGRPKKDITGQRFGQLVAVSLIGTHPDGHSIWRCKCDCGLYKDVSIKQLQSGHTQSCGCLHSKNEANIEKILLNNNLSYQKGKRFIEIKNFPFDFYVNDTYIIEYDGEQHFHSGVFSMSTDEWNQLRKHDLLKNKYCFEHSIPIIRIPYNIEYCLNDLKLETTRFLLTPENEQNYYTIN